MTEVSGADAAVIVYREDDTLQAHPLPVALTEDLAGLITA